MRAAASSTRPDPAATRTLVGASVGAGVVGCLVVLVAGLVGGSPAAAGAAVGAGLAVGVLSFGTFVVGAATRILPGAAVLVALLTYTLQVLVMAIAFVVLRSSGLTDSEIDPRWLAGGVIATTLAWLAVHLTLALRARIPVYDLAPETEPQTRPTTRLSPPEWDEP